MGERERRVGVRRGSHAPGAVEDSSFCDICKESSGCAANFLPLVTRVCVLQDAALARNAIWTTRMRDRGKKTGGVNDVVDKCLCQILFLRLAVLKNYIIILTRKNVCQWDCVNAMGFKGWFTQLGLTTHNLPLRMFSFLVTKFPIKSMVTCTIPSYFKSGAVLTGPDDSLCRYPVALSQERFHRLARAGSQ